MKPNYNFLLPNVDGRLLSFDDYPEALGFIVAFICNHCPYVIGCEDRIIEASKKYSELGYPLIAISSNDVEQFPADSFENMKLKAEQRKFPFPYLYDETKETARAYGAERTPHFFVLRKTGTDLELVYSGAMDDNPKDPSAVKEKYLDKAMEAVLRGMGFPATQAIGCTIKWKKN